MSYFKYAEWCVSNSFTELANTWISYSNLPVRCMIRLANNDRTVIFLRCVPLLDSMEGGQEVKWEREREMGSEITFSRDSNLGRPKHNPWDYGLRQGSLFYKQDNYSILLLFFPILKMYYDWKKKNNNKYNNNNDRVKQFE